MSQASQLRRSAEAQASDLPPLLADARHLATTVLLGSHGRRRAGIGDEFWQYRQAGPGDSARSIDWRRSARSEGAHFVREKEWQAAQTVSLWVDPAQSMAFTSSKKTPPKGARARLLAMAAAILLARAGERVGIPPELPPRLGEAQLLRIAAGLSDGEADEDYGHPDLEGVAARSKALYFSDFLGEFDAIEAAVGKAADRGITGALVQVLDRDEVRFPYDGRTRFQSMAGVLEFETQKAGALRQRYLDRLQDRKDALRDLARAAGWQFHSHLTETSPTPALLWIYRALEAAG